MRWSRDVIVVVVLVAGVAGLAWIAGVLRDSSAEPPSRIALSTHTVEPQGTQALQRWLEAMGHPTVRIEGSSFSIPGDAQVLFVLGPTAFDKTDDSDAVLNWVARGNTLIALDAAEVSVLPSTLANALNEGLPRHFDTPVERASLEQPILGTLPTESITVNARHGLNLIRSDYVEYLSAQGAPLLVSFKQGRGLVWLSSAPYIFTNEGLHDEADAALVGAMLSNSSRAGLVAFDEYHLGFDQVEDTGPSVQSLLATTPWGWAIVYSLIVVFAFLAINGKRFGRVQPLPQTIARRSPAEYVTALAQLYRRAGKHGLVQHHYVQHLKRRLGRPYRLNPDLPDEEFVAALARQDDRLDREGLAQMLRAIQQERIDETALVKWANQAVKLSQRRG